MTRKASLSVRMFGFLGTSFPDGKESGFLALCTGMGNPCPSSQFCCQPKSAKKEKKKKVLIMEFNLKNKTRRIHKNLLKMGQGNKENRDLSES